MAILKSVAISRSPIRQSPIFATLLMKHDCPKAKLLSVSYALLPSGKVLLFLTMKHGHQLLIIPLLMKVSELLSALDNYLRINEDCEIVTYCESMIFDDGFHENFCEPITDLRIVNDWPLPGDSLITIEAPQKKLILFYGEAKQREQRPVAFVA